MLFISLPPFCILQRVLQKIDIDQATGIIIVPNWPTQTWWPYLMSMLINYPIILPRKTRTLFLPAQPQEIHPLHKKLELVGDLLSDQGISKEASELLFKSWRTGTQKQYRTYLERWKLFCTSRKVNPLCATITNGIDFLVTQYKRGLTYSSLNTARCALSTVILLPNGNTFGNHPLVTRLMKGVFGDLCRDITAFGIYPQFLTS